MRRIDPSGHNLADEVYWTRYGYTAKIDTLRSRGRRIYDVWDPADQYVGEARSLREAEELIRETIAERAPSACQSRC